MKVAHRKLKSRAKPNQTPHALSNAHPDGSGRAKAKAGTQPAYILQVFSINSVALRRFSD